MPALDRTRCLLAALLLAILAGTPVAGEELHHAGLVVRHGDGRIVYAYVAFPEESISGVELLRRSGISLVTVGFGGLGEGVCTIDGEGCPAADCRKRVCQGSGDDAPFWHYVRQRSPGEWVLLSLGASATKVRDGDVDGWSWTGGDPGLPALTLADVAHLAGTSATPEAAASGELPTPAVRTIYPPGMGPMDPEDGQGTIAYLAGAGAIVVVGGAAFVAARRRARPERAA
ncbi:MAG: hypothetical protein QOG89_2685 [Thermomicrobiales bacterium]|nr:hypothetical protein [Thermomicrobiales bacterium]